MAAGDSTLQDIAPARIEANPDNPRLIFREDELNQLLESIREVGIQVPLAVYRKGQRFVLIDGERRWRCARKLNLATVPAIVQPQPTRLENILMMFNIHNVKSDWELMPMALKLGEVRDMLLAEGSTVTANRLGALTGVPLPTVRRALGLLELPRRYQTMLLREADKPSEQQRIKPDLFVEINKSKSVISRYAPEVFDEVSDTDYVDAMVQKYLDGTVNNVVQFRELSKIARVERVGGEVDEVVPTLVRLVRRPKYSISEAYQDTVETTYRARDITTRASALLELLRESKGRRLPKATISKLKELWEELRRYVEG